MLRNQWIVIILIALIFLVSGFFMFQTKTEVINREVEAYEVALENIVYDKGIIHLNGFTNYPEKVQWISDDVVSIEGQHVTYGDSDILVDLNDMTLKLGATGEQSDSVELSQGQLLKEMEGFKLIYIDEVESKGIYKLLEDGSLENITEHMVGQPLPYFKVSDNEKKLLYIEDEHNYPVTYDFASGRKKIIKHGLDENTLLSFQEYLNLSPDGGFLSIESKGDTLSESKVHVYGADSGRVYGFDIMGMDPQFASNSKSMYFLYTGDDETVINRIGQLILKNKSIKYRTENSKSIHPDYFIEGDNLYYMTHNDGILEQLVKMDDVFDHTIIVGNLNSQSVLNEAGYLYFDNDNEVLRLDMMSSKVERYNSDLNLLRFYDDVYFYVKDKGLYKANAGVKRLVFESDSIVDYWLNEDLSRCVVSVDDEVLELKIVTIQ